MAVSGVLTVLVDDDVHAAGVAAADLLDLAHRSGADRAEPVTGAARHPELLAEAARRTGAASLVLVTGRWGRPSLAEARAWAARGGLDPLRVQVVALEALAGSGDRAQRTAYAGRLVAAAVAAARAPGPASATPRPLGEALTRRGLLHRLGTWSPVVDVDAAACLGAARCGACLPACPAQALLTPAGPGAAPYVDADRCTGCTRCVSACPAAALDLHGHTTLVLARRLQALLDPDDGAPAPVLVVGCTSALGTLHRMAATAGLAGVLPLEVAGQGGVGPGWYLAALAAGARALGVLPCADCRVGEPLAEHVRLVRSLLAGLGDPAATRRVLLLDPDEDPVTAIRDAGGLDPLMTDAVPTRMPGGSALERHARTVPRVAAWAVAELARATRNLRAAEPAPGPVVAGPTVPLGALSATGAACTACDSCVRGCPTGALSWGGSDGQHLVVDPASCTGCRRCVLDCPEDALSALRAVDVDLLAHGPRVVLHAASTTCVRCHAPMPTAPEPAVRGDVLGLPATLARHCPDCRPYVLAGRDQGRLSEGP